MVSRGIIVSKENIHDVGTEDGNIDSSQFSVTNSTSQTTVSGKSSKQEQFLKKKTLKKYRVRVPLIHGISGDNSAVPDNKLPFATYCPLPGSAHTELNVGDLVYIAIVDFKFDDMVILGCVTSTQITGESISGIALQRVQYLAMDENAPLYVSKNIQIGDDNNFVNYDNLMSLQGFKNKLTEYVWPVENGGTGVKLNKNNDASKKEVRDNFGIPSTVLISQSKFDNLEAQKKLESNTIYYIWDDEE